jgi:hypothetical protein
MIADFFFPIIVFIFYALIFGAGFLLFIIKKNPVLRIVLSSLATVFIVMLTIILTISSNYNISYFVDIFTIYFILGFANCLLYFIFFNKRT